MPALIVTVDAALNESPEAALNAPVELMVAAEAAETKLYKTGHVLPKLIFVAIDATLAGTRVPVAVVVIVVADAL